MEPASQALGCKSGTISFGLITHALSQEAWQTLMQENWDVALACCLCKPVLNHSGGGGAFRRLFGGRKEPEKQAVCDKASCGPSSHTLIAMAHRPMMPWNMMPHRSGAHAANVFPASYPLKGMHLLELSPRTFPIPLMPWNMSLHRRGSRFGSVLASPCAPKSVHLAELPPGTCTPPKLEFRPPQN